MLNVLKLLSVIVIIVLLCIVVFAKIVELEVENTEARCQRALEQICRPCRQHVEKQNELPSN